MADRAILASGVCEEWKRFAVVVHDDFLSRLDKLPVTVECLKITQGRPAGLPPDGREAGSLHQNVRTKP